MKVFLPNAHTQAVHNLYCTPAATNKADSPSEWLNPDGTPQMLTVKFEYGEADVASNLGRYLIDNGLASKSRLIL